MVNVGQVVMKIAGRDAGELGVVVDILDVNHVLVEGLVRRRKCNLKHLEFLGLDAKIKKKATHEEVLKALRESGLKFKETKKGKKKEFKERPRKVRKGDLKKKTEAKVVENSKEKK